MKLYELTAEYARLLELAEEHEAGDALLDAALEDVGEAIEVKCAGIGKVLAQLNADAAACTAEAQRLQTKAKRLETNAENLRAYVQHNMVTRGIESIKAETFSFKLSLCPERVEVDDLAQVPEQYKTSKTTVTPDKRAILQVYKTDGECVPGTRIERGTRLVIK